MKSITVSKEHENLIDVAVSGGFKTNKWSIVDRFDRGLTSSSLYKISVNDQHYIARISDIHDPHNNLAREYNSMIIAAERKVGPAVHYSNSTDGIVIIDFIDAHQLTRNEICKEVLSKQLGAFIRNVHECKNFQDEKLIFHRVDMIHAKLPLNLKENRLVELAMGARRELEGRLNDLNDLRSSHADVNPYNLLFDKKKFYLVDWATAAQENLYFDLATCARFFYFSADEAADNFLIGYFGRIPTNEEKDKFAAMKIFVAIYYGIMFLFISSLRNKEEILSCAIDQLPSYAQFSEAIAKGEINLNDADTQQKMGFIFLKMVEAEVQEVKF